MFHICAPSDAFGESPTFHSLGPLPLTPAAAITSAVGGYVISWVAARNATSYSVYESSTNGGFGNPVVALFNGTSIKIVNNEVGVRKYITVVANNGDGTSSVSNVVTSVSSGQIFPKLAG